MLFNEFEKLRLELLSDLENARIDKALYLKKTLDLFSGKQYMEPDSLTSMKEGLFYYYYFNTLAKNYIMRSREEGSHYLQKIADEYYEIKENVLYKLLPLLEKEEFEAYYVEINSVRLKKRLVEVYVSSMDKVIFHSMKPGTINYLKRRGHLGQEVKKSRIETYINSKYY